MIECEKLMIDNYVIDKTNGYDYARVVSIDSITRKIGLVGRSKGLFHVYTTEINGIELNDTLIRFNIGYDFVDNCYIDNIRITRIICGSEYKITPYSIPFKHLHEYQNQYLFKEGKPLNFKNELF